MLTWQDWLVCQFSWCNKKFPAMHLPHGKEVELCKVLPPKQRIKYFLGCESAAVSFSERL
jgi:hypothetical protein